MSPASSARETRGASSIAAQGLDGRVELQVRCVTREPSRWISTTRMSSCVSKRSSRRRKDSTMAKWSRERIIREILRREASGLSLDLGASFPTSEARLRRGRSDRPYMGWPAARREVEGRETGHRPPRRPCATSRRQSAKYPYVAHPSLVVDSRAVGRLKPVLGTPRTTELSAGKDEHSDGISRCLSSAIGHPPKGRLRQVLSLNRRVTRSDGHAFAGALLWWRRHAVTCLTGIEDHRDTRRARCVGGATTLDWS